MLKLAVTSHALVLNKTLSPKVFHTHSVEWTQILNRDNYEAMFRSVTSYSVSEQVSFLGSSTIALELDCTSATLSWWSELNP